MEIVSRNCEFAAYHRVSSIEDPVERMRAVSSLYGKTEDEIRSKCSEIMLAVLANSYFEFLYQKPILDCKQSEIDNMLKSEIKYYQWRGKKTPSFDRFKDVVNKIVTNL